MEKKNIQERIDEIYNGNSKIPFMQSKDILCLGYEYGLEDGKNSNINKKTVQEQKPKEHIEEKGFVGTTKDIITYAESKISNKDNIKNELEKEYQNKKEEEILEAQVQISGQILNYIDTNHNIFDMFDYIKKMNNSYQDKLRAYKMNHGKYHRR